MMPKRKSVETCNKQVQTRIRCFPHVLTSEGELVKVFCDRTCQTVASIPPTAENSKFYTLLQFVPYELIVEDAERELDLPRRALLHWDLSNSTLGSKKSLPQVVKAPEREEYESRQKGVLKKSHSLVRIATPHHFTMHKAVVEHDAQTTLKVSPHVLDDDEVASVFADISIQTSITCLPKGSITNILPQLKANLSHITGSSISAARPSFRNESQEENLFREKHITKHENKKTDRNQSPCRCAATALKKLASQLRVQASTLKLTPQVFPSDTQFEERMVEVINTTIAALQTEMTKMLDMYTDDSTTCACAGGSVDTKSSASKLKTDVKVPRMSAGVDVPFADQSEIPDNAHARLLLDDVIVDSDKENIDDVEEIVQNIFLELADESPQRDIITENIFVEEQPLEESFNNAETGKQIFTTITSEQSQLTHCTSCQKLQSTSTCEPYVEKAVQKVTLEESQFEEGLGDFKYNKHNNHIDCECYPADAGAAPPVIYSNTSLPCVCPDSDTDIANASSVTNQVSSLETDDAPSLEEDFASNKKATKFEYILSENKKDAASTGAISTIAVSVTISCPELYKLSKPDVQVSGGSLPDLKEQVIRLSIIYKTGSETRIEEKLVPSRPITIVSPKSPSSQPHSEHDDVTRDINKYTRELDDFAECSIEKKPCVCAPGPYTTLSKTKTTSDKSLSNLKNRFQKDYQTFNRDIENHTVLSQSETLHKESEMSHSESTTSSLSETSSEENITDKSTITPKVKEEVLNSLPLEITSNAFSKIKCPVGNKSCECKPDSCNLSDRRCTTDGKSSAISIGEISDKEVKSSATKCSTKRKCELSNKPCTCAPGTCTHNEPHEDSLSTNVGIMTDEIKSGDFKELDNISDHRSATEYSTKQSCEFGTKPCMCAPGACTHKELPEDVGKVTSEVKSAISKEPDNISDRCSATKAVEYPIKKPCELNNKPCACSAGSCTHPEPYSSARDEDGSYKNIDFFRNRGGVPEKPGGVKNCALSNKPCNCAPGPCSDLSSNKGTLSSVGSKATPGSSVKQQSGDSFCEAAVKPSFCLDAEKKEEREKKLLEVKTSKLYADPCICPKIKAPDEAELCSCRKGNCTCADGKDLSMKESHKADDKISIKVSISQKSLHSDKFQAGVQTDLMLGDKLQSESLNSVIEKKYSCSYQNKHQHYDGKKSAGMTYSRKISKRIPSEYEDEEEQDTISFNSEICSSIGEPASSQGKIFADDRCGSETEIPWKDILLPKNCKIIKVSKPKGCLCQMEKSINASMTPSISPKKLPLDDENIVQIHVGFDERPSSIIKVERGAASQLTLQISSIFSNLNQPKRMGKEYNLQIQLVKPSSVSISYQGKTDVLNIPLVDSSTSSKVRNLPIGNITSQTKSCSSMLCKKVPTEYSTRNVKSTPSISQFSSKSTSTARKAGESGKVIETAGIEQDDSTILGLFDEAAIKSTTQASKEVSCQGSSLYAKSDICKEDSVMSALKAYEAEMKPLLKAVTELQEKIRNLNVSDTAEDFNCTFSLPEQSDRAFGHSNVIHIKDEPGRNTRTVTRIKPQYNRASFSQIPSFGPPAAYGAVAVPVVPSTYNPYMACTTACAAACATINTIDQQPVCYKCCGMSTMKSSPKKNSCTQTKIRISSHEVKKNFDSKKSQFCIQQRLKRSANISNEHSPFDSSDEDEQLSHHKCCKKMYVHKYQESNHKICTKPCKESNEAYKEFLETFLRPGRAVKTCPEDFFCDINGFKKRKFQPDPSRCKTCRRT